MFMNYMDKHTTRWQKKKAENARCKIKLYWSQTRATCSTPHTTLAFRTGRFGQKEVKHATAGKYTDLAWF